MEQAATRSERVGDLCREVNALLGLLSYSAERHYPDAIRDSLRALLKARVEELEEQGKRSQGQETRHHRAGSTAAGGP